MEIKYKNPVPTVDIIIQLGNKNIVLIERKNPPLGWALPGGFVDYGENLENAAKREALEETGLEVSIIHQLHTYSDPDRDERQHTISTVFIADAVGMPIAGDDAKKVHIVKLDNIPFNLCFDHNKIITDYKNWLIN